MRHDSLRHRAKLSVFKQVNHMEFLLDRGLECHDLWPSSIQALEALKCTVSEDANIGCLTYWMRKQTIELIDFR